MGVVPSLFTLGNAICGFAAIVQVSHFATTGNEEFLVWACWLLFLAMVFDAFDGKIARMTGYTSDFGAQLDSLSDAVSFGIAPAFMVAAMHSRHSEYVIIDPLWAKITWFFALCYASAAILRLARFNVENVHDESHHYEFKGLPSPAAAGAVISLVMLQYWLKRGQSEFMGYLREHIGSAALAEAGSWVWKLLPLWIFVIAYLMVSSRIRYPHMVNLIIKGRRTFDYFAYLIFGGIIVTFFYQITLPLMFVGYVLAGPVLWLYGVITGTGSLRVYKKDQEGDFSEKVYIGLGSNIGNRVKNLRSAIRRIKRHEDINILRRSSFYKTKPAGGPTEQRDFLNGVLEITTDLSPIELLEFLQSVEIDMGRVRTEKWGPRKIDLDIVLYGGRIVEADNLQIPHPRLHEREFVLKPLAEIAPELIHPERKKTTQELMDEFEARQKKEAEQKEEAAPKSSTD
jgi:2-amino-4-hydroxy-6-hydroxymethyldihydropteridine diphosphokinase/CDP-diacylglycerol--serine O-phosphatidyltransferase